MSLQDDKVKLDAIELYMGGFTKKEVGKILGLPRKTVSEFLNKTTWKSWWESQDGERIPIKQRRGPKILVFDIETAPILGSVWRLFDQNVSLNMIHRDWYCLSWAAKWVGSDEVMYQDKRDSWQNEDDSELLKGIWQLLDEADMLVSQNGKNFDVKKLNARFILNGMTPPSSYRHVDTLQEAKKNFGFTSNKLEYMTDKLCKKYKKLKHGNFAGFELWKECLAGNPEAWNEMETYNIYDVLSLEELYFIMVPWMKGHPNMGVYYDDNETRCPCGSTNFTHSGYHYTNTSKFSKFACDNCGREIRDKVNLIPKDKRPTLGTNII